MLDEAAPCMSLRDRINNNATLAGVMAAVLFLAALALGLAGQWNPSDPPREVYFWDVEAAEPFVGTEDQLSPTRAPSGGQGVRAHLFTCGECEPAEWFGYLERYSDAALALYEEEGLFPGEANDVLIRELGGARWVPDGGEQAERMLDSLAARCDEPLIACDP